MNFFFIQGVYSKVISDETKIVKYMNRSIIERHCVSTDNNLYIYSVADLNEKIEKIKKTKMPFFYYTNSSYPMWYNYQYFNKEVKEYTQLVKSYISNNKKGLLPQNIVYSCKFFLNDDGCTICKKIIAKVSLFDVFSAKEILDLFDKIGTYKFATPVVYSPGIGYCELSLIIR